MGGRNRKPKRPSETSSLGTFHFGGEEFLVVSVPAPAGEAASSPLTAAEREVAVLVGEGLSNAEIAKRRRTSARTVANQIASIYRKTGASSRVEIAARAKWCP